MENSDRERRSLTPLPPRPAAPTTGAPEQQRTPTLLAGIAPRQDAVRIWSPDAKILHSKARGFVLSMAFAFLNGLLELFGNRLLPEPAYSTVLVLTTIGAIAVLLWLLRNLGSVSYQIFGLPYCVSTDAEGIAVAGRSRSHRRRWSEVTSCCFQNLTGRIYIYAEGNDRVTINLAGYCIEDRHALVDTIVASAALPISSDGQWMQEKYGKPVGRWSLLSNNPLLALSKRIIRRKSVASSRAQAQLSSNNETP